MQGICRGRLASPEVRRLIAWGKRTPYKRPRNTRGGQVRPLQAPAHTPQCALINGD
ncbi:MAG: hypothetical protein FWG87_14370 [Defluviitaleaceae bacterium]|nr:hypothetical protein [Defluviitaleaceae bacterium]